ncbi:hypothetical protein [Winogradskyella sp. 4-2091]|uniref:hypothetical protein n=1 Tax=Winogradskyella sp. 4-2091 TaxID=3381659 RepID=UPI0038919BC9
MKILKHTLRFCLLVIVFYGCTKEDDNTDFIDAIEAPINVSANVTITQDNSGLVTLTPLGEGVTNFVINLGDGSELSDPITPGSSLEHTYEEGSYEVLITAYGLNDLSTTISQTIVVSFQAPQNLVVTIENDGTLSKTVNVTASADFAMFYEVSFGEDPTVDPTTVNIGETISFTYQEAGIYTIFVEAMGGAIATTSYSEEFEVTAILQPLASADIPPARASADVISIFSSSYTDVEGSDFFPDWGQGGCCGSGWSLFDLEGDEMLQYSNLSYQGNQIGETIDVSQMEYLHLDVWTADVLQTIEVSLISVSNGERPIVVDLTPNEWTTIDIPISDFTSQTGFTVEDIHQLKYVGTPFGEGGTAFIDNIYFYRAATEEVSIAGTWRMSSEGGSLGVGPSVGDTSWFACDDSCVAERSCYFDDAYVFGADGSFANVLGTETWIEPWQGGSDACGTPVAPHDGSVAATYTFDAVSGSLTVSGVGAYIGLPKANNEGELPNVSVPNSITYTATLSDNNNTMDVYIESGAGVFWQYRLVKDTSVVSSPIEGSWQMSSESGSLGVGPSVGDTSWFACDDGCVAERSCYFDDTYVFGANNSFANVLGTETWIEPWQGGTDACGTPVPPHDGSAAATYVFDESAGTLTINGTGAYIGLPKANNQGELPNVAVPESIVYSVTLSDNNNTMDVYIESGAGVFWQYKLTKI